MDVSDLLLQVSDKNVNVDGLAELVVKDNNIREELIKQLLANQEIMVYYHCYYIISKASQERPELFYKYWNDFSLLLQHKNSYHRDIGLTIIANLTKVDSENRFQKIFKDYISHVNDEKFMTARCCVQNSKKIICNKIEIEKQIVDIFINIDNKCGFPDKQKELLKNDILEVFDDIYAHSSCKSEMGIFVKNQVSSTSPKTRKQAKRLIEKYGL